VDEVLARLFVKTGQPLDVLRTRVVGQAVAMALGMRWSWSMGQVVRAGLERMGGRLFRFHNRRLVAGVRPRHFDEQEAQALGMELRERKRAPRAA
jgi:hypothetical protein